MKEKILPLGLEAAFATVTLAAASYVLGSLYHYGYFSVFGLQSMVSTWSVYDTMFVTWRLVLGWIVCILVGIIAKSLWEYRRGRPLATDPAAKRVLHLIELTAILIPFYGLAIYSYQRGLEDANAAISGSRRVEAVNVPGFLKGDPVYFVAHIDDKYIFCRPSEHSGGKITTYVVAASELRSVKLEVAPVAN